MPQVAESNLVLWKVLRAKSSVSEKELNDSESSVDAIVLRMKYERATLGKLMFDAWNMSRGLENVLFGLVIEDRGLMIGKEGNHYITAIEVKIWKDASSS